MLFVTSMAVSYFLDQEKVKKIARDSTAKSLVHMGYIVRKTSRDSMERGIDGKPSDPGDPPNIQSGRLRRNVRVQELAWNHVQVFVNVKYAAIIELGDYYGHKVEARPYLVPALQKEYSRLPGMVSTELNTQAHW